MADSSTVRGPSRWTFGFHNLVLGVVTALTAGLFVTELYSDGVRGAEPLSAPASGAASDGTRAETAVIGVDPATLDARLAALETALSGDLDRALARIDALDTRLAALETGAARTLPADGGTASDAALAGLDARLTAAVDALDTRLTTSDDRVTQAVSTYDGSFSTLSARVADLDARLDALNAGFVELSATVGGAATPPRAVAASAPAPTYVGGVSFQNNGDVFTNSARFVELATLSGFPVDSRLACAPVGLGAADGRGEETFVCLLRGQSG